MVSLMVVLVMLVIMGRKISAGVYREVRMVQYFALLLVELQLICCWVVMMVMMIVRVASFALVVLDQALWELGLPSWRFSIVGDHSVGLGGFH